MIQIQKPKSKRKLFIALGIIIVLAMAAAGAYLYYSQNSSNSNKSINTDKPTKEQIKAGQDSKDATVKGGSQDTGNLDTDEAAQPNATSTPQVSITAANRNGELIQVRSLIPAVTTDGSCTLTLRNGSSSITKTASVQSLADSSTCQGFDIATSEFTNTGTWTATLTYADSNGSTQTSKDIIIK